MGAENNNTDNNMNRQPQQQDQNKGQQQPNQQNQQGKMGEADKGGASSGERIDTDGDGRTRDPNDTRPTDQGGKGEPVQR